jgi:hypothetical protein
MKTFTLGLVLMLAIAAFTFAQTIATTSDGKKVVLKDDGTWLYVLTAAQATVTDFRNTAWGMSSSRVKALEASPPVQEQDGLLVFTASISSLETHIGYFFTNGILTRARYAISENHMNKSDYITDFNTLKTQLIKKYGAPSQDVKHWKNDRDKDMSDESGLAISLGNLSYYANWATPRTQIALALFGEDFNVRLIVEYTSVDYGHLEEAQDLRNF